MVTLSCAAETSFLPPLFFTDNFKQTGCLSDISYMRQILRAGGQASLKFLKSFFSHLSSPKHFGSAPDCIRQFGALSDTFRWVFYTPKHTQITHSFTA
jgi:hypothetical protein